MRKARYTFLILFAVVGFAVLPGGERREVAAEPAPRVQQLPPPGPKANVVRQGFPAGKADPNNLAKSDTAWEVEWDLTHPQNQPMSSPGSVFRIRSAKFMWKDRTGQPQWITVARMIELGEIYVPYDNGYIGFYDVGVFPFYITRARKEYLGPNCVAPGELLKSSNPYWSETVHKEVHDDGIRWMSADTDGRNQLADQARRGEKMILWATYYGANYRYLIEYTFRDDGIFSCRLGPTGRNLIFRQPDLTDTHLHVGCWRLEFDLGDPVSGLGGPKDNDVLLVRRIFNEQTERYGQVVKPWARDAQGQAREGSARWSPAEFTTLRVQSKVRKNAHGRFVSFDLVPERMGSPDHLQPTRYGMGAEMDWVNNDFWVTRTESGFTTYAEVAQYASQKRPLAGYPTTVWHCSPALHATRGEDYGSEDGVNNMNGVALTTWAGFSVKPRELFDGSPLYEPRQRYPLFRFQVAP